MTTVVPPRPQPTGSRITRLTVAVTATVFAVALASCSGSPPNPSAPRPSAPAQESFTQAEQVSALRTAMRAVVRIGIVPGIVVLVRHADSQVVLTDGLADTRPRARMTAGERFRVASLTKPMVATVVMQLVQAGDLHLEDPVGKWLPGLLPDAGTITVRQLLSHTSGLPDYENLPAARAVFRHPPVDPRDLIAVAAHAPPLFAPGEGQDYSNTNYQVLGLIIEKVTGHSLESNLDQRIIKPLSMTSASMSPGRWTDEPLAHGYVDGHDVSHNDLSPGWAAGGLVADAADISRFFRALLGNQLVPKTVVDQMLRPEASTLGAFSGYGLGLGEVSTSCGPAVGHYGAWDGYSSGAFTRRDTDREVVLLVNTSRDLTTGALHDLLNTALCGP